MIQVAFGFLRIPLEFKRHPRTLQYAKCLVHRHNGLHDQPQTARTSLFNRPESTGAVFGRHWWRDMTGQKSGDAAELEDYLELKAQHPNKRPERTAERRGRSAFTSPLESCPVRTMGTRCRTGRVPRGPRRLRKSTIPDKARARIGSSPVFPATAPSVDPRPDAWNPSTSLQGFRRQRRRQALPAVEPAGWS